MEERFADGEKIKQRLNRIKTGEKVSADTPKVSIIVPAYDIAPFVKEALESVFAQTYKNFEVVLVNDGSKDTNELKTALAPYF